MTIVDTSDGEVFIPVGSSPRSHTILRQTAIRMGVHLKGMPPTDLIRKMHELRVLMSTPCGYEGGMLWHGNKVYRWTSGRWVRLS